MATTTNYGWTTPDDTALVKDGASAIRSLGTAIDTTVFNNAGAAIAKTLIDAKGDLIVGSAADTAARLAVGTNGYTLVADSSTATGLAWAAPAGGGKVLQVVSAVYSTQASTTSTSYQDSGLTASITPSSASSKVLVLTTNSFYIDRQSAGQVLGKMNIVRGATQIFEHNQIGSGDADSFLVSSVSFSYLDSPATTSSVTYKQQYARVMNAGTVYVQFNSSNASIILMEIGA
jgi:hypothetical protein